MRGLQCAWETDPVARGDVVELHRGQAGVLTAAQTSTHCQAGPAIESHLGQKYSVSFYYGLNQGELKTIWQYRKVYILGVFCMAKTFGVPYWTNSFLWAALRVVSPHSVGV